jgi:thiamin-phosphate kinase
MPVVGFIRDGSAAANARNVAAFRKGLNETGYVEGQNVMVEYHWLEGQYDRLPALVADLVRRRVAVIVTPGSVPTLAAKAATATIPIVFAVAEDPVKLGLVASLARPGSNATGINFFNEEVAAKHLGLLHELVPKALHVAVVINPANATSAKTTLQVQEAARAIGLQIHALNASTSHEIDAAFAALASERPDALVVAGDAFFTDRAVQFATLTARDRIPAAYSSRDFVAVGGLMSYGTDFADTFRQVGVYTSSILKGAKPADLPVVQATKFELVTRYVHGAGDDCAAIELAVGELVATTDPVPPPAAATIGKDSDRFWMGWLLVTINASDLAAAGASPLAFLAAIECEASQEVSEFERLLEGISSGCSDAGLAYVGGNIREAKQVAAVGVGLGLCHPHKPLGRIGASDGDLVFSIGQGGVFWRDALRMIDGRGPVLKEQSPLYKPRSQIRAMHHLAAKELISAAMDNSDGLLPTLVELATKNGLGIEVDTDLLLVPDLSEEERVHQARFWFGWGDWNVIACVPPYRAQRVHEVCQNLGAEVVQIGKCSKEHSGLRLRRNTNVIPAPRLESERFAADSWMLKGIDEYVRMLRTVPLP